MDTPTVAVIDHMVTGFGAGLPARPGAIRVLRERVVADRALVYIQWVDEHDRGWSATRGAQRTGDTWVAGRASSGSGAVDRPGPWVSLGGWWGGPDQRCYAGGRVYGDRITAVRVIDTDGRAMSDAPIDGITLLISEPGFTTPTSIELYDEKGHRVAAQPF